MALKDQHAKEPLGIERLEEVLCVVEAREGSAEAFGRLLERYERPVLYFLRRMIGRSEAAFDAQQEVWVEVFRGIRRLQRAEAFPAWLYRIARGKAARFVRREIREGDLIEALSGQENEADSEDDYFDPEAVHHALDRLPLSQREVLTLHYLEDLSLDEIASVLDCPVGTVKSRLHHGRLAMRALLGKEKIT